MANIDVLDGESGYTVPTKEDPQGHKSKLEDYMKSHPSHPSIARVEAKENSFITQLSDPLDDTNWSVWSMDVTLTLEMCGVEEYAQGRVERPDKHADPIGAANWSFNDTYARTLIIRNIADSQMAHVRQCKTAHDMWVNLEAVHEPKRRKTVISCIQNLFRTYAEEGDDIIEHLNKLQQYWERLGINLIGDEDFEFSEWLFKSVIAASLPPSWDAFTEPYSGNRKELIYNDPKRRINSQQMIKVIKESIYGARFEIGQPRPRRHQR